MSGAYRGWASGFAGMLIFSGSMPATRIAVSGFDPVFLTAMRGSIAGVLGLLLLVVLRERRPARGDLLPLAATAAGVVIGFPLLSALALERVDAARSLVFLGLLPLITDPRPAAIQSVSEPISPSGASGRNRPGRRSRWRSGRRRR